MIRIRKTELVTGGQMPCQEWASIFAFRWRFGLWPGNVLQRREVLQTEERLLFPACFLTLGYFEIFKLLRRSNSTERTETYSGTQLHIPHTPPINYFKSYSISLSISYIQLLPFLILISTCLKRRPSFPHSSYFRLLLEQLVRVVFLIDRTQEPIKPRNQFSSWYTRHSNTEVPPAALGSSWSCTPAFKADRQHC
jgi:hypothetical protein